MAFSNLQKAYLGTLKVTYGDYTSTESGATQTIGVEGGRVWLLAAISQDTTGAMQMSFPRYSSSVSGAVNTITIYNQEGVTTGTIFIVHS